MFDSIMRLGNGVNVSPDILDKACMSAIAAIKKELPEEARVYGVVREVLERCDEELDSKKIDL